MCYLLFATYKSFLWNVLFSSLRDVLWVGKQKQPCTFHRNVLWFTIFTFSWINTLSRGTTSGTKILTDAQFLHFRIQRGWRYVQ